MASTQFKTNNYSRFFYSQSHQVQSVARRLKAALSLYHNRVASFVEASNDGGDDAIRVADSAALVAMFQSAAAGAMRDAVEIEDEGGMGEIALPQDESASPQDRVSEDSAGAARQVTPGLPHLSRDHPQLTVEEEAQRPGESVLQYQEVRGLEK